MKKSSLEVVGIGSVIIGFIGLFVFSPVITFGFAYLGGMILDGLLDRNLLMD